MRFFRVFRQFMLYNTKIGSLRTRIYLYIRYARTRIHKGERLWVKGYSYEKGAPSEEDAPYVRRMRLELTRSCDHYPLKVACIPISPPALGCPEQDSNLHTSRHAHLKRTRLPIPPSGQKKRAENETRTRDPDLGKVVLYQLSYFRNLF